MELHHLTATEARDLFRRRELSPVELLDAVVARAEKVEPLVNALTETMLDEAYDAAREAERRFAGDGPEPRALEGVPLVFKEEQPIAGRTIEEGSILERGRISDASHPIVHRVYGAGAVVHGRSTTPEFSCAPFTHSKLWGVTRNPWNLDLTPGGSSGGAGAVLAAGETVLATGSDIGGSIRIPSSFCGVVGFKPPFGRVPGMAPFNSDTYCADGPMGRSVADVALLQNVLAGPHPSDQASLRPALAVPADSRPVRGMRVALCMNLGDYEVDPVIEANTRAAADALRWDGVIVEEVTLPWMRQRLAETAWAHFGAIFGPFIEEVAGGSGDQLMAYTRSFAAQAREWRDKSSSYAAGLAAEAEVYQPLGELLERYEALLCPTVGTQGIEAAPDDAEPLVSVGDRLVPWIDALLTVPFNIIGRVPVLSVPSGIAPNGVPTGVQIVGRTYDDVTVFRLGSALERALALTTSGEWWPTP
ncbi:amidase [Monashia sp. NPDC004114]